MVHFPTYQQIWLRFNSNIRALWSFSNNLGKIADTTDKLAITELAHKLAIFFCTDPLVEEQEILNYISTENNNELAITPEKYEELKKDFALLKSDEFKQKIGVFIKENPSKSLRLYNLWRSAFSEPIANGILLRRSCLVSLASFFELLESDLIQAFYFRFPNALGKPEERMISLSAIRDFSNLELIESYFVQKEASSVLQEGINKQISYFKDRLSIDIKTISEYREILTEFSQRRNLLVHNDGVVNDHYLNKVSGKYVKEKGIVKGLPLNVSDTYLKESIDTIYFVGFTLFQLCWRKFSIEEQQQADNLFIETMVDLLNQKRYELVKKLTTVSQTIKVSKSAREIISINHAIALRDTNEKQKARQFIKDLDYSQSPLRMKIAVFAIKEEYEAVYELLRLATQEDEIKNISPDWPLFKPIRYEQKFKNIFEIE